MKTVQAIQAAVPETARCFGQSITGAPTITCVKQAPFERGFISSVF